MNNFNEQKEREAQDGSEWQFGSILKDLALLPVRERALYLPHGVLQFNNVMDTNGCASRAPLNILETKLTYFYHHGMHPALKKWCEDNGYLKNGKFALNDNFIEILSGTTPTGNSLKAPVDAIRKHGVIPADMLPLKDDMSWNEYMNPKRITKAHTDLGKEFLRRFTINYEKVLVKDFLASLEEDLLDVAGHAWGVPVNGVYQRTTAPIVHAFANVTPDIDAFDTYEPFLKRLAKDYIFFDWGYSLSITSQNPYPDETLALFEVLKQHGLLSFFAEAWRRLIGEKEPEITSREKLYEASKSFLGKNARPLNLAPQGLGCAEALCTVVSSVDPTFPQNEVSTIKLDAILFERFKETKIPKPGVVIISPARSTPGHVGILGEGNVIYSNNSKTGLWDDHWDLDKWIDYYVAKNKLDLRMYEPA